MSSKAEKERMIYDYISKVDFNGDFSVAKIEEDLKNILQTKPGINIKWLKEKSINESGKVEIVSEKVEDVTIGFFDGKDSQGNPKVYSIKCIIN